ncbi:hypothetical protein [Mesorhizobium sp. M0676]|uniref:hypothetical protein n=1 Tax=Mesorhizobium sp. M0676 TaxID=2956984 RepID=UPI00333D08BA
MSRSGQTRFTGFHAPERCLPALLKLGSDQPVVGVASGIATLSERCLVSSLLQVRLHHTVSFFQIIPMRVHLWIGIQLLDQSKQIGVGRLGGQLVLEAAHASFDSLQNDSQPRQCRAPP